jgi:ABC-type molybdenum transport system ATPase subunit/photorepair protein PhrA
VLLKYSKALVAVISTSFRSEINSVELIIGLYFASVSAYKKLQLKAQHYMQHERELELVGAGEIKKDLFCGMNMRLVGPIQ